MEIDSRFLELREGEGRREAIGAKLGPLTFFSKSGRQEFRPKAE